MPRRRWNHGHTGALHIPDQLVATLAGGTAGGDGRRGGEAGVVGLVAQLASLPAQRNSADSCGGER